MDLYYRLNVFPVHVPALRERADDIPILVDYFAGRLAGRMGKRIRQIEKRTLESMQQYSWPGNIRELQNVIERGVILADSEVFRLEPGTLAKTSPKTIATGSGRRSTESRDRSGSPADSGTHLRPGRRGGAPGLARLDPGVPDPGVEDQQASVSITVRYDGTDVPERLTE